MIEVLDSLYVAEQASQSLHLNVILEDLISSDMSQLCQKIFHSASPVILME